MKGVPIKFRAKVIGTGHYITFGLGVELPQGIDTTTISQLVGYDSDGKEVYENDFLTAERNGTKYYGFAALGNAIDDYGYDLMFERLKMPIPDSYLGDDDFKWRLSKETFEELVNKNAEKFSKRCVG